MPRRPRAIRHVEKVAERVNRANNIAGTGQLGEFGGFLLNQPDPQFGRKVAFIERPRGTKLERFVELQYLPLRLVHGFISQFITGPPASNRTLHRCNDWHRDRATHSQCIRVRATSVP